MGFSESSFVCGGSGDPDGDLSSLTAGDDTFPFFSLSASPSEEDDLALLFLLSAGGGGGGGGGGGDSGDATLPRPRSGDGEALSSGEVDAFLTFLSGFLLTLCSGSLSELWSRLRFLGEAFFPWFFLVLSGLLPESLSDDGDLWTFFGDLLRDGLATGEASLGATALLVFRGDGLSDELLPRSEEALAFLFGAGRLLRGDRLTLRGGLLCLLGGGDGERRLLGLGDGDLFLILSCCILPGGLYLRLGGDPKERLPPPLIGDRLLSKRGLLRMRPYRGEGDLFLGGDRLKKSI